MGRYTFKLPDVGEGIAEAEITAWHVAVGDAVDEDTPLVDVMTDKATVEIPSPVAGRVLALHGSPGELRQVGSELVVLETAEGAGDEEPGDEAAKAPASTGTPAGTEPVVTAPDVPDAAAVARIEATEPDPAAPEPRAPEPVAPPPPAAVPRPKVLAAPAVRRRAQEAGIPLDEVPGSGPDGRITHADLDAKLRGGTTVRRSGIEEVKVIGLRRKIAQRMQDTMRRIPHFSYIEEVDVTALEELRRHLNATAAPSRPRLTVLPFLLRALARALPDFPQINALYDDEAGIVRRHAALHAGIATQTPNGLVVPVVRHAEALDLWDTAAEIARLAAAARDGRAGRDELSGSTLTITSLGPLGGLATTPVINAPEVAIVGVNRIAERPMVREGQVVVRRMMNLSSSFDHRVVDGWDAAEFIQRVRTLLEQPATLFLPE